MNVDAILDTFNRTGVNYLLIGGMNFLLRHQPILTFDVDLWIEDTSSNRLACETALSALDAEWGTTEATLQTVKNYPSGWLDRQVVFCLHSPKGAIDIFRIVPGLTDWQSSNRRAVSRLTSGGVRFRGISDADISECQLDLEPAFQVRTNQDPETTAWPAMSPFDELVQAEEQKRQNAWDSAARWRAIQETIAWAESQSTVKRNSPAVCRETERNTLEQIAGWQAERRLSGQRSAS